MQFKPIVYNANKKLDELQIFDPSLLMFISYTKGEKVDQRNGVDIIRYPMTDGQFNGQNVSMAFE